MRLNAPRRTIIIIFLFAAVVAAQYGYDQVKTSSSVSTANILSPQTIRMFDMGFHSTVGSFLWVSTMPEILDLLRNRTEYLSDVAYINGVDPKLSYPYAFSILTLPAIPTSTGFLSGVSDAMAIGQEGLANADPDWRIPYYMATNYFLDLHNKQQALYYFSVAAATPDIPYYAKRFAENFGAEQKDREITRELWESIRDTTNDPDTKARAQAYIDRLDIFDYLEAAAAQYKKVYGALPANLNQLVEKGIIPAIPQDPFGFTFLLNKDGTVTIDLSTPAPVQ